MAAAIVAKIGRDCSDRVMSDKKIPTRRAGSTGAASESLRPLDDGLSRWLSDRVLDGFDRARPDDLPGGLRLEHHLLAGERVRALARLCGGLLDDDELGEAGHDEDAGLQNGRASCRDRAWM